MKEYNKTIKEQMKLGILEVVVVIEFKDSTERSQSGTHYLPHHGVVCMSSQLTKSCILFTMVWLRFLEMIVH